ncbi:MAG: hypothetical protein A2725_00600 [Candidatus Magasanikbacteria bacterium RIFCSPHIGHO2_01_FULL_33_34]|uniref:Uncharacterized protein n=1 Tax=Candidatus Magasanikbacteria bacterium RIFCSPHIGHO2_01_FULL_33_34 TaxID=1798671 RepID=A0A1F6LLE1_9BACT|nr:MAG: hypothetical protein A2725_00600 [Candidatus Magasanikbacteria bacterium RIFCSPHIGHO2_01_FULL_33_34]OGH65859.1 MAG: hypothetical protein A3B83_03270 [Candidatus Magasanikbacteria bacterium RIFCSPHIGHO2_02_FULL_33_17]OGH75224.1 MAG: hypothetical protein A3A89_03865 [Candidatus Magasanikbacteria bacterium RIFCSPLOWO2_01_FULL_33_34]OGH81860.1 MAG: hypothetical protein A3F93_01175 [Candidatus Magasanikbacteria bacterium RIFCSPLOWO2_12_FULL_34_7]
MNLRQYLIIMVLGTVLCWISLFFVLVNIDPFEANFVSFAFFYVSVFLAMIGTFSIILFLFYRGIKKATTPMYYQVQKSFRDSIVVAIFLTVLLYLQGSGLINTWNFLILILATISLSIFLIFNNKANTA